MKNVLINRSYNLKKNLPILYKGLYIRTNYHK